MHKARQFDNPLVICGTGGSGTRALTEIMLSFGYFMGAKSNPAHDSLAISSFLGANINEYVSSTQWINRVLGEESLSTRKISGIKSMRREFDMAFAEHLGVEKSIGKRWGWKAPRSIYLLPFLTHRFSNMRVIHLVRDGRDMAYSDNQNQLKRNSSSVLTKDELNLPTPLKSIILWSKINCACALYCESNLKSNYMRIRFEDLCSEPGACVNKLVGFCEIDASQSETVRAANYVVSPASLGRWRSRGNAVELKELHSSGADGLHMMGYV